MARPLSIARRLPAAVHLTEDETAPRTPRRSGGARRDVVHRHPSDLRAVVQADAPRARLPESPARTPRRPARALDLEARAHHSQGGGGADRRARDHDPARLSLLSRATRIGERLPVVPVS